MGKQKKGIKKREWEEDREFEMDDSYNDIYD